MEITYESIEPLIVNQEIDGSSMLCEFEIPGTGETITSKGNIRRLNSVKSQVTKVVARNVTNQVRRGAMRILRQSLGGGMIGRTGSMVFNSVARDTTRNLTRGYTSEEKQNAILDAFKKVQDSFVFNDNTGIWVAASAASSGKLKIGKNNEQLSEFEKQLQKAPITNSFDKEVLARMLVEIANADGNITSEEKEFLTSFISPDIGSIDELSLYDPLSDIELEEVSPNVKETIYTLACITSLVDMDIHPEEENILYEYADMFAFSEDTSKELMRTAKFYILENALSLNSSRDEVIRLAQKINLDAKEAQRCLIQMKKRS